MRMSVTYDILFKYGKMEEIMVIPKHKELCELIAGDIGLQRLQNRLYPSSAKIDRSSDSFTDYSQQGFLKQGKELLETIRKDWQVVVASETSHREIAQALRQLMDGKKQLHPDFGYRPVWYMTSGYQTCPWGCHSARGNDHGVIYHKKTDRAIMINTLHPHLIEKHFFFQGEEVYYRLDPQEIIRIFMLGKEAKKIASHLCRALQSSDKKIVHYALFWLQNIDITSIRKCITPYLKTLLSCKDRDLLKDVLQTIAKLGLRELAQDMAPLLSRANEDVQSVAKQTLEAMNFVTTPIFSDIQSAQIDTVVCHLASNLQNNNNVEESIRTLGLIGQKVPQDVFGLVLDFIDSYPTVAILSVLRIIKNSPHFISCLSIEHWHIVEALGHEKTIIDWQQSLIPYDRPESDNKKHDFLQQHNWSEVLKQIEQEDLFFHFVVAGLQFNHAASLQIVKNIKHNVFHYDDDDRKVDPMMLVQTLLENDDEEIQHFISRQIIKAYAPYPPVSTIRPQIDENVAQRLIKFVQRPPKLTDCKPRFFLWMIVTIDGGFTGTDSTWANIMFLLQRSPIEKEQIARHCLKYIHHHDYLVRIMCIFTIGELQYTQATKQLTALLDVDDRYVRQTVIKALENMGPLDDSTINKLIGFLDVKEEEYVVDATIDTLGNTHNEKVIDKLIEFLGLCECDMIWRIVYALQKLGALAEATDQLLLLLDSDDKDIQEEVVGAFGKIKLLPQEVELSLLKVVAKREIKASLSSRDNFIQVFRKKTLDEFWQTCNQQQKEQIIKNIGYYVNADICEIFLCDWQQYINGSDHLRFITFCCISKCITEENAHVFFPTLLEALKDKNLMPGAVRIITKILGILPQLMKKFAIDDTELSKLLVDAMEGSPSYGYHHDCREILIQINGNNAYGLDKFLDLLANYTDDAIALLQPLGDVGIDAIYQQARDGNDKKAKMAVYALYKINTPKCVTYLSDLVLHDNPEIKTRAAQFLCEYTQHKSQAVKTFIYLLQSQDNADIEIALTRLGFLSDNALQNLQNELIYILFAVYEVLHLKSAQQLFFRWAIHPYVKQIVLECRPQYTQHWQAAIFDTFCAP
ncbi:HEAT repeat domain-containing protein [Candidatus Uabimicrobium amorphum]|uniref:HEAT repeat domain-containing protein n=1 Tax=Uabimicrobium amorphum TaxID=2596890 RepID=A0A5S9F5H8_UABAM|nr:HEAT repeat domain-containing protein [Candidatus Uabimicrobium amorphum]BBM86618.1 hypothetical protein UABAM_05004 [Candidatus Uabimicrobium amorphum]